MRRVMLTTLDNPFDPFTAFPDWVTYDEAKGYNTLGYIARIAFISEELSEKDIELIIEDAIDEIIELNIIGLYKKVVFED
jgi:hypothetical protein